MTPFPYYLVEAEEKRIYDEIFRGNGDVNPYEVRQELTDTLNDKAYVYRNESDMVAGLKKVRELKSKTWKHVDDHPKEPIMKKHPVTITNYKPVERKY